MGDTRSKKKEATVAAERRLSAAMEALREAEEEPAQTVDAGEPPEAAKLIDSEDAETHTYEEDVYTILFLANWNTWSFFLGIVTVLLQFTILSLALVDLLGDDDLDLAGDSNPLNVPKDVELQVAICQAVALFLAIVSLDDITVALKDMMVGYHPELLDDFSGATFLKFWGSAFARFLIGLEIIATSFVFVVQASTILDIFLNMAAIHFVADLDNLFFTLARRGFFGPYLRRQTRQFEGVEVAEKLSDFYAWLQVLMVLILYAASIVGWWIVWSQQSDGIIIKNTSCGSVLIEFGDEVYPLDGFDLSSIRSLKTDDSAFVFGPGFDFDAPPDLHFSYFSGIYTPDFAKSEQLGGRPRYQERGVDDDQAGLFYYCEKVKSWVFTIPALANTAVVPPETKSDCEENLGWLLKSPPTLAFSLENAPTENWRVWTGNLAEVDFFRLGCAECSFDSDCGINRGTCNKDTNRCDCSDGYEGIFCNEDPKDSCNPMDLYLLDSYDVNDRQSISLLEPYGPYKLLEGVEMYRRPVFYLAGVEELPSNQRICFGVNLILYTGRRWYDVTFFEEDLAAYSLTCNADEVVLDVGTQNSGDRIHAFWGNILLNNTNWFSEPTDSYFPTGPIQWFEVGDTKSLGNFGGFGYHEKDAQRFECKNVNCAKNNICGFWGECVNTPISSPQYCNDDAGSQCFPAVEGTFGQCVCDDDAFGHFCEFLAEDDSTESPAPSDSAYPTLIGS